MNFLIIDQSAQHQHNEDDGQDLQKNKSKPFTHEKSTRGLQSKKRKHNGKTIKHSKWWESDDYYG